MGSQINKILLLLFEYMISSCLKGNVHSIYAMSFPNMFVLYKMI